MQVDARRVSLDETTHTLSVARKPKLKETPYNEVDNVGLRDSRLLAVKRNGLHSAARAFLCINLFDLYIYSDFFKK